MRHLAAFVLACLLVSGCASAGNEAVRNETPVSVAQKITKGLSTKETVLGFYGAPSSTSFTDSGNEIWNYEHIYATAQAINFVPVVSIFARGEDVQKNLIVFFFDKNGVVQNYTVSRSQSEIHRGIGS